MQLVEEAIRRVQVCDQTVNAVVHTRFERALSEAATLPPGGAFRGVPIVLKDWGCESAGDNYSAGSRFLRRLNWRSKKDSILTARLRSAGFVIIGRTNTSELAMSMTTEPLAFGPTRNPWRLDRTPGGSSGGSAAAVAAGYAPVAQASDVGGSIRIPASYCGLVGMKPSRGRVVTSPGATNAWAGYLTDGILTRTVRDTVGILGLLSPNMRVTASSLLMPGPYGMHPEQVGRVFRIGLLSRNLLGYDAINEETADAVISVGLSLQELGHEVCFASPEALEDPEFFGQLW